MSDPQYYDPYHDAQPQSPPLEPVKPKFTPSPSPQAVTPQPERHLAPANFSTSSSRRRRKAHPATQSDFVLIRSMDPNRPDIAQQAGKQALKADSESEHDPGTEEEDDMGDHSDTTEPRQQSPPQKGQPIPTSPAVDLQATAGAAIALNTPPGTRTPKLPPIFPRDPRDSVVDPDPPPRNPIEAQTSPAPLLNGISPITNGVHSGPRANEQSQLNATSQRNRSDSLAPPANGYSHESSLATSPRLAHLRIPQSKTSPGQILPALQTPHSPLGERLTASPRQEQRLPSFRHLSELAETAITEQQETNRGFPHRQSISSSTHSPKSIARQPSINSALSPGTAFAPSPVSASGEPASKDIFLRSSHLSLFSPRRPSQAAESPYSSGLHSASTTTDSYQSSDGLSPGSQPTPIESSAHRMSIDGALTSRTLPPPTGPHIQHIPPHGAGGFKCDHPGCTAPPFQTQYLLKYVNVFSHHIASP
jgi:hypothetical protein